MLKALTVSEPFASLIVSGEKWVENRVWDCTYRGELAIHAGRGTQYMPPADLRRKFPHAGSIVGVAVVVGCVSRDSILASATAERSGSEASKIPVGVPWESWRRLAVHRHVCGEFCLLLAARVLKLPEPVPCRGLQKIWTADPDVEARVRSQMPADWSAYVDEVRP